MIIHYVRVRILACLIIRAVRNDRKMSRRVHKKSVHGQHEFAIMAARIVHPLAGVKGVWSKEEKLQALTLISRLCVDRYSVDLGIAPSKNTLLVRPLSLRQKMARFSTV